MKNFWLERDKTKNRFLEEAMMLESKWAATGLLDRIPEKFRGVTAVLLEGQRLFNEAKEK